MKRACSWFAVLGAVVLGGGCSRLQAQAPHLAIEDQLRAQYHVTKVGANGMVVGQAGTILVIQPTATWSSLYDGLWGLPAESGEYWYTTYNKDGRAKNVTFQHGASVAEKKYGHRILQPGEKVYLTNIEVKPNEIAFIVQTCGVCDPSTPDPNNPPYRARLAFEFDKDYLSTATLKQVVEHTDPVLALDTSPPGQPSRQMLVNSSAPLAAAVAVAGLKYPSTYVSAQAPTDQIQLNADHSFSLQEGGQAYHGTFAVNGSSLELTISESNTKTTATLQGNNLMDSSGQTWTRAEQPAGSPPSPPALQNEDVIKMVKAGLDDATVLAKISNSKCQFDTSTDALIKLKQSGVSPAVLKAMVGAGK